MSDNISAGRKLLYYSGLLLIVLGLFLFFSSFFSFAGFDIFGGFNNGFVSQMPGGFVSDGFGPDPSFIRAIVGILMTALGQGLMRVGARGVAGSGLILDPERAREDLRPFSKAVGGVVNDVIENIDAVNELETSQTTQIVKIKCRNCNTLNDENAKFCMECGKAL